MNQINRLMVPPQGRQSPQSPTFSLTPSTFTPNAAAVSSSSSSKSAALLSLPPPPPRSYSNSPTHHKSDFGG